MLHPTKTSLKVILLKHTTQFLIMVAATLACTQVIPEVQHDDPVYTYARQRVEEARRQKATQMPAWLKKNREVLRDAMAAVAQKSFEETGIWFLS